MNLEFNTELLPASHARGLGLHQRAVRYLSGNAVSLRHQGVGLLSEDLFVRLFTCRMVALPRCFANG
jgi:hypothetical protein